MSEDATGLEALVARYLDRRDDDSDLTPGRFADEVARSATERAELVAAIERALAIAATLEAVGPELPGSIGPYRVVRELGRGGAGVVYEVEYLGRHLALKRVSGTTLGPHGLERFRREARLLTRIDHPGVVRVLDSGSESGDAWLALELVDGTPLSALVRRGPLAPTRAARVVRDLARAVAAVHAAGVVHRDLKPANVMLDGHDRPVLVDFGLGAAEDEVTLTATGALLGTPRYMAPEQARGEAADRRSDVYALGLVLWELLAGAPARPEPSRTTLLRDVGRRALRQPRVPGGSLDPDLARVLAAALAHEPGDRLGEATLLADDLERWLAGEPVRARPPGPLARARSFARRRPAVAGGVALSAVVALALAGQALRTRAVAARAADAAGLRVDRALAALVLRDAAFARAEAEAALRADPRSRDARALVEAVPLAADRPPAAELIAHAPELPTACTRLALAAETARGRGDVAGAERLLNGLARLAPDLRPAWSALAATRIDLGEINAGLDAALHALELGGDPHDRDGELPRLLARAPEPNAVRDALAERLARTSDAPPGETPRAALWFALAWTQDAAHEIEAAERAYRGAVAADPLHVKAHLCLAHLYSGAQLGACAGCERAYARWPALQDPERSIDELLVAIELDRGTSEGAVGRALETALALGRRGAGAGPLEALLAAIRRCRAEGPPSPQADTRLADAERRLEGALGR